MPFMMLSLSKNQVILLVVCKNLMVMPVMKVGCVKKQSGYASQNYSHILKQSGYASDIVSCMQKHDGNGKIIWRSVLEKQVIL